MAKLPSVNNICTHMQSAYAADVCNLSHRFSVCVRGCATTSHAIGPNVYTTGRRRMLAVRPSRSRIHNHITPHARRRRPSGPPEAETKSLTHTRSSLAEADGTALRAVAVGTHEAAYVPEMQAARQPSDAGHMARRAALGRYSAALRFVFLCVPVVFGAGATCANEHVRCCSQLASEPQGHCPQLV